MKRYDIDHYMDIGRIARLRSTQQNPAWHAEGNVYNHTKMVMDNCRGRFDDVWMQDTLMTAAMLHDIGKPACTRVQESGKITSYGHDAYGAKMVPELLDRIHKHDEDIPGGIEQAGKTYVENIQWLVREHMKLHSFHNMRETKLNTLMEHEMFPILLELHRADCLSSHQGELGKVDYGSYLDAKRRYEERETTRTAEDARAV